MNGTQDGLRTKLMENGMSWEEAQDEIDNLASDAYDREQDRLAEQHFMEKANERETV
jgi:hypothetical protein